MRSFFVLLVLWGCSDVKRSEQPAASGQHSLHPIVEKFVQQEYQPDSVSVSDSLLIKSLGATLYHANIKDLFDGPRIMLIRDHETNAIYENYLPGWPAELDVSCELQLEFLKPASRSRPNNYMLRGLESFLNQSTTVRHAGVSHQAMDSLLVFWWPDMREMGNEIRETGAIERILDDWQKDKEITPRMGKRWISEMRGLLKDKAGKEEVWMYPAMAIFYFELRRNPGEHEPKGTRYNLIAFRIGFNGCPD